MENLINNNVLRVSSKSINIDLENYNPGRAIIKGYTLKDAYDPPSSKIDHGQYRIIIESPLIRKESDFNNHLCSVREIVKQLTVLTKCVLGEALNTSPWELDAFTKRLELLGQMPEGWESNYFSIQDELDKRKQFHLHVKRVEPRHFFCLPESPFVDYIKALKHYPGLKPIEIDLLQILNDADLVSFTGRYMLLGKALEIVNAMYPLKGKDSRIQDLLPELIERFNGTTIKDLLNLANNRKETRHYVNKSKDTLSHQEMSVDERKLFYALTNQLCINLLRRSLGLNNVDFGLV